jgi:hypothetical protein
MGIKESTFITREIGEFLFNTGNTFASSCWESDHGVSGQITYTNASKWFQRYFPTNQGQYLFRLMECHVTQYSQF